MEDDGIDDLGVTVTRHQPLADIEAQIAADPSVGFVDRLALTNRTTHLLRNIAGTAFKDGIVKNLIGLNRQRREGRQQKHQDQRKPAHSAGTARAGVEERAPAATR